MGELHEQADHLVVFGEVCPRHGVEEKGRLAVDRRVVLFTGQVDTALEGEHV